jgi:RNA polymerase sigma-70 factor (ECF subfamily)
MRSDEEVDRLELACSVTDESRGQERKMFDQLMEKHHKQAYNVAFRMSGNHSDAEDLTQEAFIRAYRFFGQYKREMPFEGWLYRIMTNVFIDGLRRKPKAMMRSLDQPISGDNGECYMEIEDKGVGPEEAILSSEVENKIQDALKTMPDVFRLTVIYADIEGLSYEEVAEATRTNVGTVRSRLHRGRRMLREKLGDMDGLI